MSIWNDCEQFQAVPFYGFPVIPKLEGDFIIFEFPKGYEPNGSKTIEVAEKLIELCGSDCTDNLITNKIVKVKLSAEKLPYLIYNMYMNG